MACRRWRWRWSSRQVRLGKADCRDATRTSGPTFTASPPALTTFRVADDPPSSQGKRYGVREEASGSTSHFGTTGQRCPNRGTFRDAEIELVFCSSRANR